MVSLSMLFGYSMVLCAVMRFYEYSGPDYRERWLGRWYRQSAVEQWLKDQTTDVWEILDD